ncbi:protein 5NUC [Topomyia yanbarensis]|uniref:protein 5NUC n=1 Tax=Topomyia yanbarensis TaxID=2498891 RepID=UPI00273AB8BA|nr:protein 5NUC [Topomyia yanbarensis]XP_058824156.1 protein 5NUC [Topomyia yanbarensis]XP_058824157.1 protein 5NUC [Topomyia yanbarensis]XP_058824158.1 protein 5NUC [Topomyia yanbarensis]
MTTTFRIGWIPRQRRRRRQLLPFSCLLVIQLSVLSMTARAAPRNENFQLVILHNNDMHARFEQTGAYGNDCQPEDVGNNRCYGGFARVAHKIREYRKEEANGGLPVLYLNAGDTYTGTPWFTIFKDNITAAFLNLLKPDAISLGNHEFDLGVEGLVPFLNEVDFPVLATNLDLSETPSMQNTKSLHNSIVFVKEGVKIGVIGYLTPETKQLTPSNTVLYTDEIQAINKEAAVLKAQGVNILIALGHSGLERDQQIAAGCPDIDLVIGGHSHTFLYTGAQPDNNPPEGPYPVMVKNLAGRDVPVVQAYAYTKYLGHMKLEFDPSGNLVSFDGSPILLNGAVARDSDVLQLLELYRPGIQTLEEVIGQTKVLLDSTRCRFEECNIGNMIADSMVKTYALSRDEKSEYWTDASIAFIQGGGIRDSIVPGVDGNITKKDLLTVLPFGNAVILAEVTGEIIRLMLEHSVARYDGIQGYGEFLQMAGIHVVYDLSKPPGQRVASIEVQCAHCSIPTYGPIYDYDRYKIFMNQFLWEGGDGYDMFNGRNFQVLAWGEYDMAEEYLKRYSPIYPAVEWRVTLQGKVNPDHMTTTTDSPGSTTTAEDDGGAAGSLRATAVTVAVFAFISILQRVLL